MIDIEKGWKSQITRPILLNIDKIKAVIDKDTYCFIYEKEAKASFFRTTISRMNKNFLKLRKITLSLTPPKVTIEKRKKWVIMDEEYLAKFWANSLSIGGDLTGDDSA